MTRFVFCRLVTSAAAFWLAPLAAVLHCGSAQAVQVAYVPPLGTASTTATIGAYLIDWQAGHRARVVALQGAQGGSVTGTLAQRVVTLDAPLSKPDDSGLPDSCGEYVQRRSDTTQIVVRPRDSGEGLGSAEIVEVGKVVTLEGCDIGREVPFGAITDPGVTLSRIAMDLRPPISDLSPGTRIAGFSENVWEVNGDSQMSVDVVTLYAGGQGLFERTGNVVPVQIGSDRWLRFTFPTFERGYTRLTVDDDTGAETWLRAEWSGGEAQRVWSVLAVKVGASAGFGPERKASRVWETGLFSATSQRFYIALYVGGTGERINKDLTTGAEARSPITWAFAGKNIQQTRLAFDATIVRTWVPLRNHGDKVRFVMESDFITLSDGTSGEYMSPRINYYIDTGKAVAR